jgi:ATP:corrinoid adenosyltransferase
MRQHIDVGVFVVRQCAAADRRVVGEGLGDELRILQQRRELLGHLWQRLVERLARGQQRMMIGAELIERVGHDLLSIVGAIFNARLSELA